jgi:YihY family inner membrane protein
MDFLAPLKAVDRFQRRHVALAMPFAVVKKFGDDQGGNLSALIAYYGFLSLFPLILVFVTGLGFVLDGNPHAQHAVLNSALKQIPLVGDQIKTGTLKGSGLGLVIGILGAIFSGLGVTLAAQTAFNRVQAVTMRERPNFLWARVRGLGLLAVLGGLQVLSTVATGLVSGGFGGVLLFIAGVVVSLVLNLLLFFAAFRLLTDESIPTSELWPGIFAATVLWTVLQSVGGAYVGHVVHGANSTYGTFATVIGLLAWLFLGARIVVLCAELNSVISRRLWPRGLFDPPTDADREALTALAKIEERKDEQEVDVEFDESRRVES